jgi:hypothetical protein
MLWEQGPHLTWLFIAIQFLNCERELLELWWRLEIVMQRIFQEIKNTATKN